MEQLAYSYILQPETAMTRIDFWIAVAGCITATLIHTPGGKLRSGPYLAAISLCVVAMVLIQHFWPAIGSMMAAGRLWVLVLGHWSVSFVGGYLIGCLAQRRSIDAFGHGGKAYLAFVPLANIWLLLKKSQQPSIAEDGSLARLAGWTVGVLGMVLLLVSLPPQRALGSQIESAAADNPSAAAALFNHMAQTKDGVKAALHMTFHQIRVPVKVDQHTVLDSVAIEGTTLTYHYALDSDISAAPASLSEGILAIVCRDATMKPILAGGGTLEYSYANSAKVEIRRFRIDQASCS